MNEKQIREVILAIGAMTEMWSVAYNNFLKQGYSPEDARLHTESLMRVVMTMNGGSRQQKGEEE